ELSAGPGLFQQSAIEPRLPGARLLRLWGTAQGIGVGDAAGGGRAAHPEQGRSLSGAGAVADRRRGRSGGRRTGRGALDRAKRPRPVGAHTQARDRDGGAPAQGRRAAERAAQATERRAVVLLSFQDLAARPCPTAGTSHIRRALFLAGRGSVL